MGMSVVPALLFAIGISTITFAFLSGFAESGISRRFAYLRIYRSRSAFAAWLGRWRDQAYGLFESARLQELIRLAGGPPGLTALRFQGIRAALVLGAAGSMAVAGLTGESGLTLSSRFPFIRFGLGLLMLWIVPVLVLGFKAKRRKTLLMFEISRLSHRLTICMSDKAELREIITRAGRTQKELRPYLAELSTNWNKNQYEAIIAFGKQVGITEVYPLVNTLLAASKVEAGELAQMLDQQIESIDKTMEHEMLKKIENVPLFIVFLIMIPFMVVFVLLVYPWMSYMSELLGKTF